MTVTAKTAIVCDLSHDCVDQRVSLGSWAPLCSHVLSKNCDLKLRDVHSTPSAVYLNVCQMFTFLEGGVEERGGGGGGGGGSCGLRCWPFGMRKLKNAISL